MSKFTYFDLFMPKMTYFFWLLKWNDIIPSSICPSAVLIESLLVGKIDWSQNWPIYPKTYQLFSLQQMNWYYAIFNMSKGLFDRISPNSQIDLIFYVFSNRSKWSNIIPSSMCPYAVLMKSFQVLQIDLDLIFYIFSNRSKWSIIIPSPMCPYAVLMKSLQVRQIDLFMPKKC